MSVCLSSHLARGLVKGLGVSVSSYPQHDLNHMRNEKPYRKKLKYFKKAKLQPHRILFLLPSHEQKSKSLSTHVANESVATATLP